MFDGHLIDHLEEALTDSVVAPYLQVLALARLVGTNVEYTPEKSPIELMTDSSYSRMKGYGRKLAGLVLVEDGAPQTIDLQRIPQKDDRE